MMRQLMKIQTLCFVVLFSFLILTPLTIGHAQDYVTGSFEGEVKDGVTGAPIAGATVRITNQDTGVPVAKQTDSAGRFRQNLLPPGEYTITILKPGYVTQTTQRSLSTMRPTVVLPPVPLVPESTAIATESPKPGTPVATATPAPSSQAPASQPAETKPAPLNAGIQEQINTNDAQRGGTYTEKEVSSLPLGATTLTRTFDELALLLPGIASPPQTQGSVAGPGVGSGVGSAGQFSANGLRSRSNNFTVDGSDNNDEDIGVRRQGFLALVPQPIESIREFQVISLLAPAQYGRNMGAQVNAISKSGGNETHGTVFGLLNSSQLNARNFFDTTNGNATTQLRSGNQNVIIGPGVAFNNATLAFTPIIPRPVTVTNQSGAEDSFTLVQGGFVLGGPLVPDKMFYFISTEGQLLHATKEASFAVPTVAQRGLFGTGASGIFVTPFPDVSPACLMDPAFCFPVGSPNAFFPTSSDADAIFSLFPFPNNPNGVYGANTLTQVLPASGQGKVISGKVDGNWKIRNRQQAFTARYNFTDDWRDIPVTGEAIFSTLRPRIRTQNFSNFLNSELSDPSSTRPLFNQLRLSYGRTRLIFDDNPDRTFLIPSGFFPSTPFLLNAPLIENFTLPAGLGTGPNTGNIVFRALPGETVERQLGPIGQVSIAGFSPAGVDVFNFPQRRVNNTYQLADTVSWHVGRHSIAFGTDIRRTELNSDLPRNSRPLITFNGAPRLTFNGGRFAFNNTFIPAIDLAAASAASGFFQTLSTTDNSTIHLRYYQYDFFGQDEWRIRPNLSLSLGLRYEYNTPPTEGNSLIERTFNDASLALVPGLRTFVDGRTKIFDPDKNNFAPRIGVAYSPNLFGPDHTTVIRAGYGMFYDQILGAVVSQSRNVFPTTVTVNLAGGTANLGLDLPFPFGQFGILNPVSPFLELVQPGTLNRLNPAFTLNNHVAFLNFIASGGGNLFSAGGVGITLPARRLETPWAHEYSLTVEQQLNTKLVASAGYVGTMGRNLLRATSPNLGPNAVLIPLGIDASSFSPTFSGVALQPGSRITPAGFIVGGRPVNTVGAVTIYETSATSRYDALQLQLRGRYNFLGATQFQVNYTYGKVTDDVSDVFDLAGASALPQNSLTFAGERGPANFDVRHRVSSNYIGDFSSWGKSNSFLHAIFNGLEIAGTGTFQTGQPFTVNSIFDVNLDGNLTDRLNSTSGILVTGDRSQPLRLTVNNPSTLLANVGQDGSVPRNSFRAGNLWLTNAAVTKTFRFSETTRLILRTDVFNLFNRANYGVPVRLLESPGFGKATDTVTPARRIQFGLKLAF